MEKIIEEKYFSNEEFIEEITIEEIKDEENYKYFEGTVNFTKYRESQYIIPFIEKDYWKTIFGYKQKCEIFRNF